MKLNIDYRGENDYSYFKNIASRNSYNINSVLNYKHNWLNEITILLR